MANNNSFKKNPTLIIMKRELSSYFTGPIAYIVTGLFLIISGITFFSTYFIQGSADLRGFFGLLPLLFSFFVPALTMRLFAEERRSGSIETLLTLPVTEVNVVAGKFLAAFVEVLVMVSPTLFYVVTAVIFGNPDFGPIVGGYLGIVFLSACFASIGVFASSITKNQIIAFFTAFIICIVLTMIDSFLVFLPTSFVDFFAYISANAHFTSISKGIIDTRDLLYFASITALFFVITVKIQQKERK
ncbi:MAG: ABC transporter permease subunit [Treponema sp.]|nr:ABC transporter permease subunit [Treponema sp.]